MEGLLYFFVLSWQRLGNDLLQRPQEASYSTIKHTDLTERKLGLDERKENEEYVAPKNKRYYFAPFTSG